MFSFLISAFFGVLAVSAYPSLSLRDQNYTTNDTCLQGNVRNAREACQVIHAAYPDQVSLPSTANYSLEANALWDQAAWKEPACVFSPFTTQDLAGGLQILVQRHVDFAVRSGGHMPVVGHASIDAGGVMIATTYFKELQTVDAPNDLGNASYVRCGAALRWQEVYEYLGNKSLISAGGRVSSVGSSLLLGGGLSYLSGSRGWAANNIVNYEVVLANSSIIQVNNKTHPDLFWALKGGGNNFGIVARYDLYTYPTQQMYGGTVTWGSNYTQQYLDAQTAFILPGGGSDDVKAAIMPNFGYDPITKQNASGTVLMYDEAIDNPPALENFTAIPTTFSTVAVQNFADITESTSGFSPRDRRWSFYNLAVRSTADTMNMLYSNIARNADNLLEGVNCSVGAAVQPITASHLRASINLGGDAIDLDPEQGNFVIALVYGYWFDPADDGVIKAWTDATLASIRAEAEEKDMYYPWLFLNDAGVTQDPIATYGYGKSLSRMREVARRYDPAGVFQRNVPGFKLSGEVHSC